MAKKGEILSEKTKKKISLWNKQNPQKYWLGKKLSEETRKKLSIAHTGKKFLHSDETKKKIGNANRGKVRSEEIKEMISKIQIGKKRGPFSEEHKERISKANKGKKHPSASGEKAYNWKGGYENRIFYNRQRYLKKRCNGGSHTLNEWKLLKARYDLTCLDCKKREPEIKLTEDHIVPIIKGGSNSISNIQPLCMPCNRKKWIEIISYVN